VRRRWRRRFSLSGHTASLARYSGASSGRRVRRWGWLDHW
jgi:hypothetical protein